MSSNVKVNKSEQVGQKNKATKEVQFKTNLGGKKVRNLSSEILLRLSQDQNQLNEEYEEELKKKLDEADVIIEVLDARHPQDFRNEALEALTDKENKTLVLLLNKVDLVPDAATVENWLKYYSQYYYCCSFRSITTKSRSKHSSTENLKTKAYQASKEQLSSGYSPLGCYQLMNILNKIARKDTTGSDAAPRPISVVFVGYPNVGKSSVINSMMRNTKHAVTGNKPGVTTRKSDFQLFSNIKLSDTPGVLDLHKIGT
uniref:Guanine nucleotide-binding protein-like NSN1 n=1 Tax=Dermatophagoides pteronyssinus TaxID=6956 RepID=A0A6P6YB00_DERPT|nr:guanine nucleotide-binding protein-like NSN1 [Dermatophagoides pteronyssinus]